MAQGQPIFILPEGTNRLLGRDAQRTNILAGKVLAETVRTTLGPKGMDKMLVDLENSSKNPKPYWIWTFTQPLSLWVTDKLLKKHKKS